jgi:hypothetical protein
VESEFDATPPASSLKIKEELRQLEKLKHLIASHKKQSKRKEKEFLENLPESKPPMAGTF